ncbi:hypothetical protein Pmani_032276 [Petrolisthes manimaculis]|uniref:Transmembrane protein n=1 Tax=Petrolisthes manimaculis TaxID=1843537 RepID=A0AAE1TTY5_9EUCA|nr:hypothetical protein Pmani_032276 [Petrolisthes manimaculis]
MTRGKRLDSSEGLNRRNPKVRYDDVREKKTETETKMYVCLRCHLPPLLPPTSSLVVVVVVMVVVVAICQAAGVATTVGVDA